ncbi:MAG: V-type ATP synthase subunit D [Parcubacteria group bacterium]|nr:V-type ATP synthase subunit D [Parcubacteria group bacterium]|tara:strand:+ start:274 stop:909 length:636 start_codon:yes stop_codon:yes gene_type:complete
MANQLNVNPTRQELLKLKVKLKTAQRGHKLLKEKRDGLMKNFMAIIRQAKDLRQKIEEELGQGFFSFIFFSAKMRQTVIDEALLVPTKKVSLEAKTKNVMGVDVPVFEYQEEGDFLSYDLATTSTSLDRALETFSNALKTMVELAEIEHSAKLLAAEIEKTRRRVNALEYVFIPNMQETLKYITDKLNEQERATIITLMKVKDTIAKQEAR